MISVCGRDIQNKGRLLRIARLDAVMAGSGFDVFRRTNTVTFGTKDKERGKKPRDEGQGSEDTVATGRVPVADR